LAFVSDRSGNYEIYVMDLTSRQIVNVSNHHTDDYSPAWSTDGRLAFASRRSGNWDIYIMDKTGALTQATQNQANDYQPSWRW
jgi:TolB protein